FAYAARLSRCARDSTQALEALAWHRIEHGIADTEKAVPRHVLPATETLAHFGERHRREIEHRLRGEQVEVRQGLVGAGHHEIDLICFGAERRVVARERRGVGPPITARRLLERESESLNGAQSPRDPRR